MAESFPETNPSPQPPPEPPDAPTPRPSLSEIVARLAANPPKETTEKQITANRANARKSTGPKTPRGKSVVRLNALKHGATAETLIVPFIESAEEWEAHRLGIFESLAPVGALETDLALRIAVMWWRLGRVTRFEREIATITQENFSEGWKLARLQADFDSANQIFRLVNQLPTGGQEAVKVPEAVHIVSIALYEMMEQKADSKCRLAWIPNGRLEEFEGWTVELVRLAIASIAEQGGTTFEELFKAVFVQCRTARDTIEPELKKLANELDSKRRKRLMPDEGPLMRITRYESHLERSLYRAMYALERLQEARQRKNQPGNGAQNGFVLQNAGLPSSQTLLPADPQSE